MLNTAMLLTIYYLKKHWTNLTGGPNNLTQDVFTCTWDNLQGALPLQLVLFLDNLDK